jgi:uncharacterized repeat protein (TIGR01451 family)
MKARTSRPRAARARTPLGATATPRATVFARVTKGQVTRMNRWTVVILSGAIFCALLVFAPLASAHHAGVVATLSCNGTVRYTVTADTLSESRNNPDIVVSDTSGIAQPVASGVFNAANHWSFSGSYRIPANVTFDIVSARALGVWGDGFYNPSAIASVVVTRPSNCSSIATQLSSTKITVGQSAHDSATLSGTTKSAGGTVTYKLYADASCSTTAKNPSLSQTVNVSNGSVPDSSTILFANAGIYYWQATYTGDSNNGGAVSPCTSEVLTVDAAPLPAPVPSPGNASIALTKSPKLQTITSGSTATFTIVVTNNGDVTLTNVVVTDAQSPGCARTSGTLSALATMLPGASVTYDCTLANVTDGFTNLATSTATPPSGLDISGSDTAVVSVTPTAPFTPPTSIGKPLTSTRPSISIVKHPSSQTIGAGATATFTITVKNTGDVILSNVTVTDPLSPNCDKSVGALTPGASRTYTCSRRNVQAGFTNVALVTGKPPTGPSVSDRDSAVVNAAPFAPPKGGSTTTKKKIVKPRVVAHTAPQTTG